MSVAGDNNEYPDATIELFSAFADQWLDPEKRQELVDSLRSDPHVRAVYIEQAIVHSLLFRKARRDDVAPLLSELILESYREPIGLWPMSLLCPAHPPIPRSPHSSPRPSTTRSAISRRACRWRT